MRKVQLTIKQEEVAPATTSDLVVMNNGRTLKEELSTSRSDQFSSEATVTTSMEKVVDGAYSGAYEHGVMYGRSLVNLVSNHKIEIANGTTNSFPMTIPMDVGKKYLISFKIDTAHTSAGEPNQSAIKLQYYSHNNNKGYNFIYNSELADGREFKFIVEPFSGEVSQNTNFFAIWLTRYESGTLRGKLSVFEYVDGMENWEIPYFDGLCDVKMPILRNTGKNIVKMSEYSVRMGATVTSEGENWVTFGSPHAWGGLSYILQLKPNTTYSFSFDREDNDTRGYIRHWINNREWSGGIGGGSNHSFTTNDTGKVYLSLESATVRNNVTVKNLMLEESPINTQYEDYKTNILHTPETVTLRSLPNGVRDELNVMTGEYIKRIGEVVLNGTENNWITIFNFNGTEDYSTFKLDVPLLGAKKATYPINSYVVDKLGNEIGLSVAKEFVHINNQPRMCIKLLRTKLSEQTVAGLKTWLQANPITIQYELETPIITKVALTSSAPMVKGEVVLPDGTYNTYDLSTGEHIQRVKKVVLDGSEAWRLGTTKTNTQVFELVTQDLSISPPNNIVCDTFPINNGDNSDIEKIAASGATGSHDASSSLYVAVLKTKASTVEQFKSFLNSNPITVWYKLKEFIVTQITDPESLMIHSSSPVVYKGGHVMLESSYEGPSLLPEFVYSVPTSKSGVLSTTSKTILKHEQRLHQFEDLLLRESLLMDYRLTLAMLDSM